VLEVAVTTAQPRLVVVVSFDQYRGDYPKAFAAFAGKRGFARMRAEGAEFTKCLFGHATTTTGPGHATLLTGANAARTGIIGNDMCDLRNDSCFYCGDPALLEVPTIGDLLRKKDAKSKVIGVSQKDRAAILMAGRKANAVMWIDKATGSFTTSSSFPTPPWLNAVATTWSLKNYAGLTWKAEIPESKRPAVDDAPWERTTVVGRRTPDAVRRTFPYRMPPITQSTWFNEVAVSPYAVDAVFGASLDVMDREKLGRDEHPDLLCVGISATDYLGHLYGPDSREVQEMYVHCDRWLGRMIDSLDAKVGRKNYVLIVTSDHGVASIPESVNANARPRESRIDAGRWNDAQLIARADSALTSAFGKPLQRSWIRNLYLPSLYIDRSHLERKNVAIEKAIDVLEKTFLTMPGVGIVVRSGDMAKGRCPDSADEDLCDLLRQAYHPARSGEVLLYPKPNWILGDHVADHGTPWDYDRWVPLMLLGGPVKKQSSKAAVSPADIAPTIAAWLGLTMPPIDGKPLRLKK
jgi:arylsulfatase A-like enzyme